MLRLTKSEWVLGAIESGIGLLLADSSFTNVCLVGSASMCREWNWPSQHIDDLRIIRECFSQTNILFTPFPEPPPNPIQNLSWFSKTGFLLKLFHSRNKSLFQNLDQTLSNIWVDFQKRDFYLSCFIAETNPVSRTLTKPCTKFELI